ncbi:outer membrane protein assembly factor BamB [Kitasatospora sp. MAA19]|uniref:outer membrane protein assembly factor BamB family protein n=1 Tax=Kitasatospora sp. MAA19 TaxID=3035090 RepID=UPI002474F2B3|nr:PQQ-binding-like beta-propeller repeat protein [Kitasatospora sp. MAA19]MDH6706013.1 outer membrane protein assembly factor BamB [Kitasatospora sp. MAA19]
MAGDHPTPGAGEKPGSGPQDNRGVSFGRPPGGVDPAAVADQMTQLDGSAIPGPASPAGPPPAQPPAPPAQPPAGGGGFQPYAPTAAAFPGQAPPPPAGAPMGPYDPVPGGAYGAPDAGQAYGAGYGYPQQQPGYGYPGAPVPPAPKQRNPVMLWGGIIGGVLAIAIVAGLIVLLKGNPDPAPSASSGGTTTSGGTSGGTVTDAPTADSTGGGAGYNIAWSAAKAANADSSTQMLGIWGTDKVAVRADSAGIRAFNTSDGKEAWTIPVPAGSKELCSASYSTNSKSIAAVSFNTGDSDCSTVGAVDISQGKLLWTVKVSNDRVSSPTLSVTDKVVAIGGNVVGGLSIDNGSAVWQFQPRDKDCSLYGRAAGNQLAVSDRCYGGSGPKSQLVIVDADSGKAASTPITLTGTIERIDKVVQDQPLVLLMSSGPNGDYILPFDKTNKPGNQMSVKEPGADSLRLSGQSDAYTQNVVSGTTLYAQITGTKSAVNAYDLTTGKRLWSAASATSSQDIRLVSGTDKDGKVRAIVSQGYNKPARLVTLSPTDGSMTDLGTMAMPNGLDIGMSLSEYVVSTDGSAVYAFRRGSSDAPLTKWKK